MLCTYRSWTGPISPGTFGVAAIAFLPSPRLQPARQFPVQLGEDVAGHPLDLVVRQVPDHLHLDREVVVDHRALPRRDQRFAAGLGHDVLALVHQRDPGALDPTAGREAGYLEGVAARVVGAGEVVVHRATALRRRRTAPYR